MIDFGNLLAWIKPTPKYLIPIGMITTLLLFLPDGFLLYLGVINFVESYRLWIALSFLFVCAMLFTLFGYWIIEKIGGKIKSKRINKKRIENLNNLSPEEKATIASFIIDKTKSKEFVLGSGIAVSLSAMEIIYRASVYGDGVSIIYNIQSWAWMELNKNSAFLEPEFSIIKEMKNL